MADYIFRGGAKVRLQISTAGPGVSNWGFSLKV